MARFNLSQLYATTFGFTALPFSALSTDHEIARAQPFDALEVGGELAPITGLLGTPIHLPLELDGWRLPNEPLIDVAATKLIVKTPIDGNDGTFKELYSNGDYELTIRGICIDDADPDRYPEDQVRRLRNILELRSHVRIVNRLTSLWNIEHVAIESWSFPAVPGQLGMQGYEIRCTSDREFALSLREQ